MPPMPPITTATVAKSALPVRRLWLAPGRAVVAAVACALLLAVVAPAAPRRILHEPLPDAGGAGLVTPRLDQLVAASDAAAAAESQLPPAIRTSSGLIAQPEAA